MAYENKIIDRFPEICAAGKKVKLDPITNHLRDYCIDDAITALKHELGYKDNFRANNKVEPLKRNVRHQGTNCSIRECMGEPTTRFRELINDLNETTYQSYWKKPLGRSADKSGMLPTSVDPKSTVFGKPSNIDPIKALLNPDKSTKQIEEEYSVGRELYKKSHRSYDIGEHSTRGYGPPYTPDPKLCGNILRREKNGEKIKTALQWEDTSEVTVVNKQQANDNENRNSKLGRGFLRGPAKDLVPRGFTFGKPSNRPYIGVGELLKHCDCKNINLKEDLYSAMQSFRQLKREVSRKMKSRQFNTRDMVLKFLLRREPDDRDVISLEQFYEVLRCFNIIIDKPKFEYLFTYKNYIKNQKLNYILFLELVTSRREMHIDKIADVPEENLHYMTTYEKVWTDSRHSKTPEMPRQLEKYDKAVCIEELLSNNLFQQYNLCYYDFSMPRSKDFLKRLCKLIDVNVDEKDFEDIWKLGQNLDNKDEVCVETFYNLLKKQGFISCDVKLSEINCIKQ